MNWIKCTEQMPSEAFPCIVTITDYNPFTCEDFPNIYPDFVGWDGETWNDAEGQEIPCDVIAWIRLPEPYSEEAE